MSHTLTEVDTFTATITVPDGGDSRSNAAEVVAAIAQGLANRTKNLNDHAARVDVSNTFTVDQTVSADLVCINLSVLGDLQMTGDASIPQMIATHVDFTGDVTFQQDAEVAGILTCLSTAVIPTITGNVHITGALDVDGDIFGADDVIAGDEFQYSPVKTRNVQVRLFDSFGEGTIGFGGGTNHLDFSAGSKVQVWPLRLPHGATLTAAVLLLAKAGTGTATLRLYRKDGYDYSTIPPSGMPSDTSVTSATNASAGNQRIALVASEVIDNTACDYFLHFTSGDADAVYGIRLTYSDPGPRNH